MNSKQLKIGTLFLASALASIAASAHADPIQINTGGLICHQANPGQANDFDYNPNAIVNTNNASRQITCPIPYASSSLPSPATIFVDGHNDPNAVTSCTVTVFDNHSQPLMSNTFSESAPAAPPGDPDGRGWHHEVDLLEFTPSDYISMTCTIPGNRAASIRGVTARTLAIP